MFLYYFCFVLILFFAVIGEGVKKTSQKKKYFFIIGMIMTLFQGLRWNTGADWEQYRFVFYDVDWDHLFNYSRNARADSRTLEVGYVFINLLVRTFFGHYTFFLLITCGFINYTYAKVTIKYVKNHQTLCYAFILLMMNNFPVRNTLAGVIILWALPYIQRRDFKRFCIVYVISISIHLSSILALPLYWFTINVSKIKLLVAFASFSLVGSLVPTLITSAANNSIIGQFELVQLTDTYYQASLSYNEHTPSKSILHILYYSSLLFLFGLLRDSKKNEELRFFNILLNMYFVQIFFISISEIPGMIGEFSRISYYVGVAYPILLISCAFEYANRFNRLKPIILFALLVFYIHRIGPSKSDIYYDLQVPYYSVFEDSPQRDHFRY